MATVVIGRNESQHLPGAIESARVAGAPLVFVDSGSSDCSVALAREANVEVVQLDAARAFSAARARNAGLERLLELHPDLEWVQFLDGDSVLVEGWLAAGVAHLQTHPEVSVVCGRIRERSPERSPYHRLRQIGWDTTRGEISSCPGTFLGRVSSLRSIGGFDPGLRAGEDYELCLRLRREGGKIVRLDTEMAVHDAGVLGLRHWWKRSQRDGYGYAEVSALYRGESGALWKSDVRSAWLWGLWLPTAVVCSTAIAGGAGTLLTAAYPALTVRVFLRARKKFGARDAALYAVSCVAAKFPQCVGQVQFECGPGGRASGFGSRR